MRIFRALSVSSSGKKKTAATLIPEPPWRPRATIHLMLWLAVCSLQGQVTQGVSGELVPSAEANPVLHDRAGWMHR